MARLWHRFESLDEKVMYWAEERRLFDWHAIHDGELERNGRVSVVSGQRGEEGPRCVGLGKRGQWGDQSRRSELQKGQWRWTYPAPLGKEEP